MDIPKGDMLLERLREYVQEQGELHCLTTSCNCCCRLHIQCPGKHQPICKIGAGACPGMTSTADTGRELAPGWRVEVKTRNSGTSAGTSDAVMCM